MNLAGGVIIVAGLIFFEIISSVDNAVVNADMLSTMSERGKRWFLFYGIIIAVFLIRGLLPLLIVYFSNPDIGLANSFFATLGNTSVAKDTIEARKPILLAGGGIYLVFLFFHWLFIEAKEYAFFLERHIHRRWSFWFYSVASLILLAMVWVTVRTNPLVALGVVVGSTAFFITNGFKKNAEEKEKELQRQHLSDFSKILYLELIDATFSIDGVLGAFAFTISVPLILLGSGLGALVVRYVTVKGIKMVKKYRYLKNGAMYSIGALGAIMILESFRMEIYSWVPPLITLVVVGLFFWLSIRELKIEQVVN